MSAPALSVVVPTERYETIADVVACLAAQEAADRLELVVVTGGDPGPIRAAVPDGAFAGVRLVTVGDVRSLGLARAAAVRAASAPVVVFGETHAYPEPGWARAVIEAHRGPWAVVGPSMESACPGSALAWTGLLMDYGPWVERRTSESLHDVPAHNGAYKRAVLLGLGDGLEAALDSDQVLNERIREGGGALYLESRARVRHLNVSRPWPFLVERFHAGRAYAVSRSRRWPAHRRLAYALAWPLIPCVRAVRIAGHLRRMGKLGRLGPRLALPLLVGLVVSAAGEGVGFAAGPGRSREVLSEIELYRTDYAAPPLLPTARAA